MQVNKEVLKSFQPCTDRYKNFLTHYAEFSGTFEQFIDLENITYDDKIWVAKKVLNLNQLIQFGIMCSTSVLHIFESKFPDDKRVSDCLEYLASILDFRNLKQEQRLLVQKHKDNVWKSRKAAVDAATYAADAADAATYAAAYAADAATYAAAYAATYAADAATYAATYAADAATYAADAATYAADAAREEQRKFNLELLKIAYTL